MVNNRAKLPNHLDNLSREEWENLINQYIKNENDREIAKLYYLDGWCQEDIAAEFDCCRKTIYKRLKDIAKRIF